MRAAATNWRSCEDVTSTGDRASRRLARDLHDEARLVPEVERGGRLRRGGARRRGGVELGEHAGELYALLLSAGERRVEAHRRSRRAPTLARQARARAVVIGRSVAELHDLERGECGREQRALAEHGAPLREGTHGEHADVVAVEEHEARRGWRSPARIDSSVDLPAPFAPTRATTSPRATSRSTQSSSVAAPARTVIRRASIMTASRRGRARDARARGARAHRRAR